MNKIKSIKIIIGIIYLLMIILFFAIFYLYEINQFISLDYISKNKKIIFEFKDQNIFLLSVIFFIFVIVWILLQGFGSPLSFLAGFIFGTYLGSFLLIVSSTIGCTIVYIIGNLYFREVISDKYSKNYSRIINNLRKNSFSYLIILRLIPGIPIQVLNFLPVIFNMKTRNFFLASLIGMTIPKIIYVNLASSLAKSIEKNPLDINIIYSKEFIIALLILIVFIIIANFFKRKLNEKF